MCAYDPSGREITNGRSTITSANGQSGHARGETPDYIGPDEPHGFEPDISIGVTRTAATGLSCSLFHVVMVAVIVALEAGRGAPGPVYAVAFVALALGLFLSVAALSKRHRMSREHHRLAIAGLVIAVISIVALPFLAVVAVAVLRGDFFS